MKGWIVYPRYISLHKDNAFEWMRREALRYGIELEVLFFEDLAPLYSYNSLILLRNGAEVNEYPDFVILRGYDTVLSDHFEIHGIPVINTTASASAAKDKLLTCQLLAGANIKIPATLGGIPEEWKYQEITSRLGSGPFVIKRRDGAKGEDVYLVKNEKEMAYAVDRCAGNCIAQKFVSESSGRDIRVWVIGGKAVACVMRHSENSFRSNYSLGGKVSPYELSAEITDIAERSADIIGLEFAGVDLLFGKDGFSVCEINANAGFRTLSELGDNNIPSRLFEYIAEKYRKY